VAVLATLDGLSKSTDTAVVLLSADQVVPIAREGEQSPVAGTTYKSFSDPVANAEGAVAFTAALNGAAVSKSNGSALFIRNAAGELASLARLGEAAAGIPGVTWSKFVSFALPSGEDSGPIFVAEVSGPGVTKKNNLGLWAQDSTGNLILLARTGSSVPDGPSGKTLSRLTLLNPLPPTQGSARSFNDTRRITYLATFTDSTQAIIVVRVP